MSLGPDSLVLFPTPFSAYTSGVDFSSALEDLLGPCPHVSPLSFTIHAPTSSLCYPHPLKHVCQSLDFSPQY